MKCIIENWQKVVQASDNFSSVLQSLMIFFRCHFGRIGFIYYGGLSISEGEDSTPLLMLVLSLSLATFGQSRMFQLVTDPCHKRGELSSFIEACQVSWNGRTPPSNLSQRPHTRTPRQHITQLLQNTIQLVHIFSLKLKS